MDSAVLAAVITAGISLAGTVITVAAAHRSTLAAMSEQSKLADEKMRGEINVIRERIETLSDRVEKHNRVIERTYGLEARVGVLEAEGGREHAR
ncbi:MAG: hypothetical protein IKP10_02980 [Clostridia bacterium]|nr:hypothetical protein [Clostridia bacterium]